MACVALITGGTSGIGFAVAKELSKSSWQVNIIGTNSTRGHEAAALLPNTTFFQADVRNYQQLAAAFNTVFETSHRLDFVFANAGIPEEALGFFTDHDAATPTTIPPEPSLTPVNVNFDGALYTSYLAMHYFRRSPSHTKGSRDLIITASIGGLYPCMLTPLYSASKHALVGFTRAIGKKLFAEGVRVNTICPGVVKTPLITENPDLMEHFPGETLVPIERVTDVVLQLISEDAMQDSQGKWVEGSEMHSRAVHITGQGYYFADIPAIPDCASLDTWNRMMGGVRLVLE